MIEIENRSLKINNLLLVDLLVIFMKSNAATGYIQNPINIIRNDSIVLLKLPLTVSILNVGDFETRNFLLSTKFDTSHKPIIYYYFAYFLYTLL